MISQVDGAPALPSPLGQALLRAGFQDTSRGLFKRSPFRAGRGPDVLREDDGEEDDELAGGVEDTPLSGV